MSDSVDFFLLWMTTRLRESGWPRRRGFLRRRTVVDEAAIVGACAEAVQVAIPLGAELPDVAVRLAASSLGLDEITDRASVELWFDQAATAGEERVQALRDVHPVWQRFVSITATRGDERQVFFWSSPPGESLLAWGSDEAVGALDQALSGAWVAMAWAVRHPDVAAEAFMPSESELDESMRAFGMTQDEYLSSELAPYNFSLSLARGLVSKYFDDEL